MQSNGLQNNKKLHSKRAKNWVRLEFETKCEQASIECAEKFKHLSRVWLCCAPQTVKCFILLEYSLSERAVLSLFFMTFFGLNVFSRFLCMCVVVCLYASFFFLSSSSSSSFVSGVRCWHAHTTRNLCWWRECGRRIYLPDFSICWLPSNGKKIQLNKRKALANSFSD